MEAKFFDSLYEGDSPNGVKLGMGLTGGDFWPRFQGCQILYRNQNTGFSNLKEIIRVAETSAETIDIPSYFEHSSNTTYFYLLRHTNICGEEDNTLNASAKASFDCQGNLVAPTANKVLIAYAEQFQSNRVRFVWFYSPIKQMKTIKGFRLYWDAGSGHIIYDNPLANIEYTRAYLYYYESEPLDENAYQFSIKTVSSDGNENPCSVEVKIQMNLTIPNKIIINQTLKL